MLEEILNIIIQGKDKFSGELEKAQKSLGSFRAKAQDLANNALKGLGTAANKGAEQIVKLGAAAGAVAAGGLALFIKGSIDMAAEYEKAIKTLEIVAPRFGVAGDKAVAVAENLGKSLRIGPVAASSALQRLLKSGLNIDQASNLMKRFTNEALTGKDAAMSLGDAVGNLAQGYQSEMSALMERAGISENISTLLEKEAKLRGVEISKLSEAGRAQLKYQAFIRLTNETMGSAEKFAGTYIDTQAQLQTKFDEISVKVGQGLLPIMNRFNLVILSVATSIADQVTPFMEGFTAALDELSGGIQIFIADGDAANDLLFNFSQRIGVSREAFTKFYQTVDVVREKAQQAFSFFFSSQEQFAEFAKIALQVAAGFLAVKAVLMVLAAAAPILAFVAVVTAISFAVVKLKEVFEELMKNPQVQAFAKFLKESGERIKNNLMAAFERLRPAIDKISAAFGKFMEVAGPILAVVLGGLIMAIVKIAEVLSGLLAPAIDFIAGAITMWIDISTMIITKLQELVAFVMSIPGRVGSAIESVKQYFINMGNGIRDSLNGMFKINGVGIVDFIMISFRLASIYIQGFRDRAGQIFQSVKDSVSRVFATLTDPIKSAFNRAKSFVFGVMDDIKKKVVGVLMGASSAGSSLAGAFKRMLNSLIGRINNALRFSFDVLGQNITIDLPDLPMLAKGTAGFRGGQAIINERGAEGLRIGNQVYLPRGAGVMTAANTRQEVSRSTDNSKKITIEKVEVLDNTMLVKFINDLKFI